jgi:hypothetical protein
MGIGIDFISFCGLCEVGEFRIKILSKNTFKVKSKSKFCFTGSQSNFSAQNDLELATSF